MVCIFQPKVSVMIRVVAVVVVLAIFYQVPWIGKACLRWVGVMGFTFNISSITLKNLHLSHCCRRGFLRLRHPPNHPSIHLWSPFVFIKIKRHSQFCHICLLPEYVCPCVFCCRHHHFFTSFQIPLGNHYFQYEQICIRFSIPFHLFVYLLLTFGNVFCFCFYLLLLLLVFDNVAAAKLLNARVLDNHRMMIYWTSMDGKNEIQFLKVCNNICMGNKCYLEVCICMCN